MAEMQTTLLFKLPFLSTNYVLSILISPLPALPHKILTKTLAGRDHYYPHFTDVATEASLVETGQGQMEAQGHLTPGVVCSTTEPEAASTSPWSGAFSFGVGRAHEGTSGKGKGGI